MRDSMGMGWHLRCAVWIVPPRGFTFWAPWYVCTGLSLPLDSGVIIRVYGHMMMMMMMIKLVISVIYFVTSYVTFKKIALLRISHF